jgi:hypothetical protein
MPSHKPRTVQTCFSLYQVLQPGTRRQKPCLWSCVPSPTPSCLPGCGCGHTARSQLSHTRSYSLGILSSRVRRPWLLDRMRLTCCGGRNWMVRSTVSLPSTTRIWPGCRCTSTGRQGSLWPCHSKAGERETDWVSWGTPGTHWEKEGLLRAALRATKASTAS